MSWRVRGLPNSGRTVGSYWWSADFQPRPAPAEGGLFKAAWFRSYDEVGRGAYMRGDGSFHSLDMLHRFVTVDLAVSTRTSADFTGIATWGAAPDGALLLLDLVRKRMEGPDLVPAIARAVQLWNPMFVGIEKAGFQLGIVQEARRAGLPVRELVPDKDKFARAVAATPAFEAGRVLFPRAAPWRDELEAELL
ncbi:MAG: phage terminase large subunit, partial [Polyangiaceae bacterium]